MRGHAQKQKQQPLPPKEKLFIEYVKISNRNFW